jgi:excinuclease ABC subunit C
MTAEEFRKIQPTLPQEPGVYKFIGANQKVLYVGKAVNLHNRISSYFIQNKHKSAKIMLLTRKAVHIEFTIVKNEYDALILENQLIKQFKPQYNVMLRDDKTYPWLCIKNESFPRVFLTRKKINDGSEYLGPYPSVARVKIILEQLRDIFHIRTCSLQLNKKNIESGKFKPCLEYHMGKCLAPCIGLETETHYNETIRQARNMLRANFAPVLQHLKQQMLNHADALEFEKAEVYKKKIEALQQFQSKSQVVTPRINDVDVFAIAESDDMFFVNYLKVMNGTIIFTKTITLKRKLEETKEEILRYAIFELRRQLQSESKEIIVPFEIGPLYEEVRITHAKAGDKKGLLDIAMKNAMHYKLQHLKNKAEQTHKTTKQRLLEQLKKDLRLTRLPVHIECFDNSNIQGSSPVASVVVFKNARPSKKDYRHFNIKTVKGPDDFASMEEIVFRRYKRLLEENGPLPDLILIDGGKGQLNAARRALEKLNLTGNVNIVAIAKKLEEIYYPGDPLPLHISKKSESLKLLQQIRNEAHRFAITFHRKQRTKASFKTILSDIKGIGKATQKKLLTMFKSEKNIINASESALIAAIGPRKGKTVFDFFHSNEKSNETAEQ